MKKFRRLLCLLCFATIGLTSCGETNTESTTIIEQGGDVTPIKVTHLIEYNESDIGKDAIKTTAKTSFTTKANDYSSNKIDPIKTVYSVVNLAYQYMLEDVVYSDDENYKTSIDNKYINYGNVLNSIQNKISLIEGAYPVSERNMNTVDIFNIVLNVIREADKSTHTPFIEYITNEVVTTVTTQIAESDAYAVQKIAIIAPLVEGFYTAITSKTTDSTLAALQTSILASIDGIYNYALTKTNDPTIRNVLKLAYNKFYGLSSVGNVTETTLKENLSSFINEVYNKGQQLLLESVDTLKVVAQKTITASINAGYAKLVEFEDGLLEQDATFAALGLKNGILSSLQTTFEGLTTLEDYKTFINTTIPAKVVEMYQTAFPHAMRVFTAKLDTLKATLDDKITDNKIQGLFDAYYTNVTSDLNSVTSIDELVDFFKDPTTRQDLTSFLTSIVKAEVVALKNTAIEEITTLFTTLTSNITDTTIRTSVNEKFAAEMALLEALDENSTLEDCKAAITQIKNDCVAYISDIEDLIFQTAKTAALNELDEIYTALIAKIPTDTLKTEFATYYATERAKLDAVNKASDIQPTLLEVVEDTENKCKEIIATTIATARATIKNAIAKITESYATNPSSYLPATLSKSGTNNLVSTSTLSYPFDTEFVDIDDINYNGYGEQWAMILDNLDTADTFYNVLTSVSNVTSAAVGAMTTYLDSKYCDSTTHEIDTNTYKASISFAEGIVYYNIELKSELTLPVIGSFKPQITSTYDTTTYERSIKLSFNSNNIIRYTITDDKYEFGVNASISKGTYTSYIKIDMSDKDVTKGELYQYVKVGETDVQSNRAMFEFDEEYLSAVGNKADAMATAEGIIVELYDVKTGKHLMNKVYEKNKATDFNTLWFNLDSVASMENIKICEKTKQGNIDLRQNDFYINSSQDLFIPEYNKILGVKANRQYDFEYRTRHFYFYDSTNQKYIEVTSNIPMLFIQDGDNYDSFNTNVSSLGISITPNATHLAKLRSQYDTLLPIFKEMSEKTSADIKTLIG